MVMLMAVNAYNEHAAAADDDEDYDDAAADDADDDGAVVGGGGLVVVVVVVVVVTTLMAAFFAMTFVVMHSGKRTRSLLATYPIQTPFGVSGVGFWSSWVAVFFSGAPGNPELESHNQLES